MAFTVENFCRTRPFLYHLTHRANIPHISETRILYSARLIMEQAEDSTYLRLRRPESVSLSLSGATVTLRDQKPLHRGNISFHGGWSFEDLVQALNERVFFWPGGAEGPIDYGIRHFGRYVAESPVILRVPIRELLATEGNPSPLYCRYNSGSPRCSNGLGSPRGPETFIDCDHASLLPSNVVEVTFNHQVSLPERVEYSNSPHGPWEQL